MVNTDIEIDGKYPPIVSADKAAAIVSAGGGFGGGRSQYILRQSGDYLDLHFINKPEFFLNAFESPPKFNDEGKEGPGFRSGDTDYIDLDMVPTNPAAPVTKPENPFLDRILPEDLTLFSQASPLHELVFKDLRERSDEIDEDNDEYGNDDDDESGGFLGWREWPRQLPRQTLAIDSPTTPPRRRCPIR
ncbi:hypothetical protein LXL04_038793 [Taraxacum kok-saghyz]